MVVVVVVVVVALSSLLLLCLVLSLVLSKDLERCELPSMIPSQMMQLYRLKYTSLLLLLFNSLDSLPGKYFNIILILLIVCYVIVYY